MRACSFTNIVLHPGYVSRNFSKLLEPRLCRITVNSSFSNWKKRARTSPDWLEKSLLFFSGSFFLSSGRWNFFLATFFSLFALSFVCFQSRLGWVFCENNQKRPNTGIVLILTAYKGQWGSVTFENTINGKCQKR